MERRPRSLRSLGSHTPFSADVIPRLIVPSAMRGIGLVEAPRSGACAYDSAGNKPSQQIRIVTRRRQSRCFTEASSWWPTLTRNSYRRKLCADARGLCADESRQEKGRSTSGPFPLSNETPVCLTYFINSASLSLTASPQMTYPFAVGCNPSAMISVEIVPSGDKNFSPISI